MAYPPWLPARLWKNHGGNALPNSLGPEPLIWQKRAFPSPGRLNTIKDPKMIHKTPIANRSQTMIYPPACVFQAYLFKVLGRIWQLIKDVKHQAYAPACVGLVTWRGIMISDPTIPRW